MCKHDWKIEPSCIGYNIEGMEVRGGDYEWVTTGWFRVCKKCNIRESFSIPYEVLKTWKIEHPQAQKIFQEDIEFQISRK